MDLYAILLAPPKQTNSTPTTSHWAASPTSMETAIGQLQLSSQSAGNMTPRIFGSCCSHQWTFLFAFRGSQLWPRWPRFSVMAVLRTTKLWVKSQKPWDRLLFVSSYSWELWMVFIYMCVYIYIYTHYIQVYIYIYILSYIHRYGSIASLVEPQISWHHKGKSKPRPPHISHNSHNQAFVDRVVL